MRMSNPDKSEIRARRALTKALLPAAGLFAIACGSAAPTPATPRASTAAAAAPGSGAKGCADPKIDDLEDGDTKVLPNGGRGGYWYTYADKSSTAGPNPLVTASPGADGSKQAMRMTGKIGNDKIVYVGLGFNFVEPKKPYDASAYKGIAFKAKVGKGATKVRVKLPDVNTDPDGKVCKDCFNDFGQDLTLSTDWKRYTVPFKDMKQEGGWGDQKPAIEAGKLMALQWQVKEAGADFDLWIDDVELTCE